MRERKLKILSCCLTIIILLFFGVGCYDSNSKEDISEDVFFETVNEVVSEDISEETPVETSEIVSEKILEENTEEISDDVSEEVSEEVVEDISDETSTEVLEEQDQVYMVEPMTATMYAQRAVNVRKGPGTDYEKIGGLSANQEVVVTGKASTGWYEISYNGGVGYVSNNYLGNDKVVVEIAPAAQDTTNPNVTVEIVTDDWTWEELTTFTVSDVYLVPDMLTLVNGHRRANGVPELTWNSAKEQEALERAKEISQNFSHQGNPADVENIAFNNLYGDANTFYMQYYNSPPHNQGMLKYSANATGISMVSATCVTSNAAGGKKYYNVILIYMDYPDNWSRVDWDNLGGTGN